MKARPHRVSNAPESYHTRKCAAGAALGELASSTEKPRRPAWLSRQRPLAYPMRSWLKVGGACHAPSPEGTDSVCNGTSGCSPRTQASMARRVGYGGRGGRHHCLGLTLILLGAVPDHPLAHWRSPVATPDRPVHFESVRRKSAKRIAWWRLAPQHATRGRQQPTRANRSLNLGWVFLREPAFHSCEQLGNRCSRGCAGLNR